MGISKVRCVAYHVKKSWRLIVIVLLAGWSSCSRDQPFRDQWGDTFNRTWAGPDFWANRLQDWRVADGRLECLTSSAEKPMRTVHLLTRRLGKRRGNIRLNVTTGWVETTKAPSEEAAAGFLIGAGTGLDYRAAALIHHSAGPGAGLFAGIDGFGRLFVRDFADSNRVLIMQEEGIGHFESIGLELIIRPSDSDYQLELKAIPRSHEEASKTIVLRGIESHRMEGSLGLVSHPGQGDGIGRFWFRDWIVSGSKLENVEERHCGPILSTQYTLSKGILKLTAQMMPLSEDENDSVELQILNGGQWKTIAETNVIREGFTAPFRIEGWDDSMDVPFKIVYEHGYRNGSSRTYDWKGMVRRNPVEKEDIVVAAFTGNHNVTRPIPGKWAGVDGGHFPWDWGVWFPHSELVGHVAAHDPDVLFFSGDQVYEGASPTAADFSQAWLDYLYKWYLWCWAFRELTRDIPAVTIPDDHDVYHGNIWGCGGKPTKKGTQGAEAQDSGGYKMDPDWVNMVQRTQSSHLPDPHDPAPAGQGIGVYYCEMNTGGVSFAVVEDRKFKSAPKPLLPHARVWNGWAQNPEFNPKTQSDAPGAELLGERQLAFLEEWASDWSHDTWMKVVLSQTLFANVATLPKGSKSGSIIPGLPVLPVGEYAENDVPVADMDSNGWPLAGRNRALRVMRKGFAVHIAGDQHLASTVQYGIDEWGDAGFALCTPSVANFWPRRWFPSTPGKNRKPGSPRYTGEYEDGFGNKMTVHAVANPHLYGKEPVQRHNLAAGYGIVRFHRSNREIVFENWPIWSDPKQGGKPYPGWPVKAGQTDNYGREAAAYLPLLKVENMIDPVVQIIDETGWEIVYTLRIQGTSCRPKVFHPGIYTIVIGEPGTDRVRRFEHIQSSDDDGKSVLEVVFE